MRTLLAFAVTILIVWAAFLYLPLGSIDRFTAICGSGALIGYGANRDRLARQKRRNQRFQRKMLETFERTIDLAKIESEHGNCLSTLNGPSFGRRGSPECIVLFLRSFEFDRQLRVRNPIYSTSLLRFVPYYEEIVGKTMTLDAALALAVKNYGELVAIGDQAGYVGATRFETSEADWRQHFTVLADAASAIVICVSHHAGTVWEVEQICASAPIMTKSVFLLPPGIVDEEIRGANLKGAARLLRSAGCKLPRDTQEGECFTFDSQGSPVIRKPILIPVGFQLHKLDTATLKQIIEAIGV